MTCQEGNVQETRICIQLTCDAQGFVTLLWSTRPFVLSYRDSTRAVAVVTGLTRPTATVSTHLSTRTPSAGIP